MLFCSCDEHSSFSSRYLSLFHILSLIASLGATQNHSSLVPDIHEGGLYEPNNDRP